MLDLITITESEFLAIVNDPTLNKTQREKLFAEIRAQSARHVDSKVLERLEAVATRLEVLPTPTPVPPTPIPVPPTPVPPVPPVPVPVPPVPPIPVPVPPPTPGNVTPILVEDFEKYTSTVHMNSDPLGLLAEALNPASVGMQVLDPTGGRNGGKACRYDFADRTAKTNLVDVGAPNLIQERFSDYGTSRHYRTPGNPNKIWAEVYAKFSSNWKISAPSSWGPAPSGSDYKFILGAVEGSGRFDWLMNWKHDFGYPDGRFSAWRCGLIEGTNYTPENTGPGGQYAGGNGPCGVDVITPEMLADGQYHRYRIEWKLSSAPGVADGGIRTWVDDVLLLNKQGLVSHRTAFWGLFLGANLNQGPGQLQSIWWDELRIWDRNPGW